MQVVHKIDCCFENVPAGQDLHGIVPLSGAYFPAGHIIHEEEPIVEYCPGWHFIHEIEFSKEYVPAGHLEQKE